MAGEMGFRCDMDCEIGHVDKSSSSLRKVMSEITVKGLRAEKKKVNTKLSPWGVIGGESLPQRYKPALRNANFPCLAALLIQFRWILMQGAARCGFLLISLLVLPGKSAEKCIYLCE